MLPQVNGGVKHLDTIERVANHTEPPDMVVFGELPWMCSGRLVEPLWTSAWSGPVGAERTSLETQAVRPQISGTILR